MKGNMGALDRIARLVVAAVLGVTMLAMPVPTH